MFTQPSVLLQVRPELSLLQFFIVRMWLLMLKTLLNSLMSWPSVDFASSSFRTFVRFVVIVTAAALIEPSPFGKEPFITPRSWSTFQLSRISFSIDVKTRASTSVVFPWYLILNVTEPELSSRWPLRAVTFCLELGLMCMFCRAATFLAIIDLVHPVSGHKKINKHFRPQSRYPKIEWNLVKQSLMSSS